MDKTVDISLVCLSVTALYLFLTERRKTKPPSPDDTASGRAKLSHLRRVFLTANLLALLADWLQGPYIHRLYTFHGHSEDNIALLFLAGYVSSCIFGSFSGPLADKFGRKLMAQVFCVVYGFCCVTKLSGSLWVLLLGRIAGGISTSCLHSVFESWYVAEHKIHYFNQDEIANTLSLLSLWNSNLAIGSGLFADFLVRDLAMPPTAPFMAATPPLVLSILVIGIFWRENYGDKNKNLFEMYKQGLKTIRNDRVVRQIGAIQALVESSMFIFVYLWTPTLSSGSQSTPLGRIFSCFMISIMVGSFIFRRLVSSMSEEKILVVACLTFLTSNLAATLIVNQGLPEACFFCFLGIEISLGIYFPAIGTLRSQFIPENIRSTVINLYRVPLNILTVAALSLVKSGLIEDRQPIFLLMTFLLTTALLLADNLRKLRRKQSTMDT